MPLTRRQRGWLVRGHPCVAAVVTLGVMAYNLWPLHSPVHACVATWYYSFYFHTALLLGGWFFLLVVQRCFDAEEFGKRLPSHAAAWLMIFLIVGVGIVAAERKWPLQAAFAFSQSSLDAIADEALADPKTLDRFANRRAGCFWVTNVGVSDSTVILFIAPDYGFARMPVVLEEPVRTARGPLVAVRFATVSNTSAAARRINGEWFVLFDWHLAFKDGWSFQGKPADSSQMASAATGR